MALYIQIIIYFFAAAFAFMALALMFNYRRTHDYGVFVLGVAYGVSAALAVALTHWWPLAAGFALVWILRVLGLDPDVRKEESHKKGEQQ